MGAVQLIACKTCHSWTYLPRPTLEEQANLHDDAEYFQHPYFQNRRNARDANDRRCRKIFEVIARATKVTALRGDRLLDVGCDTGEFLAAAARLYGVIPVGIDVASRAIQAAQTQGIEAYQTDLEQAPADLQGFSVITAIDLIEHVVDPATLLRQIFARLRPGGVTYLETPNIDSLVYAVGETLCRLTGGQPKSLFERLFPPQHIQYFTSTSFVSLAQECGFEIAYLGRRPLPFSDLGTSLPVRLGLATLQTLDQLQQREILLCVLLRKPPRHTNQVNPY
jgi:SAM-dependent methyltransferase